MIVLVTGGARYVGSHAMFGLCDWGKDVVLLDGIRIRLGCGGCRKALSGDVGRQALMAHLLAGCGITEIMHFAAKIVQESVRAPLERYLGNTVKARARF